MANFTGTAGNDVLIGTDDADVLDGRAGNDTLKGGKSNDVYFVDTTKDVVIEAAKQGIDTIISQIKSYTLVANVENLVLDPGDALNGTGNALANSIAGNGAGNVLSGGGGGDVINGNGGFDLVDGGAGNDTLVDALGGDTLKGGTGNDTYIVDSIGDKITEGVNAGRDEVQSSLANFTLGAKLEDLALLAGALNGTGNGLANEITGNGLGNRLDGGAGNDGLAGNGGSDTLLGGLGNDVLEGGVGSDTLTGGGGNDVFLYRADDALDAIGPDTITDFARGADEIALFDLLADFDLDFENLFGDGHILLDKAGNDTLISVDVDGAGGIDPVQLAIVKSVTLTESDFLLPQP